MSNFFLEQTLWVHDGKTEEHLSFTTLREIFLQLYNFFWKMMLGLPKCYLSPFSLLAELKKKISFFRLISIEEGRVFPIIRQTNLEDEHLRSAAMEKFKYGTPRHLCSKIHGAPKMKKSSRNYYIYDKWRSSQQKNPSIFCKL